jgi:hypothetical protein
MPLSSATAAKNELRAGGDEAKPAVGQDTPLERPALNTQLSTQHWSERQDFHLRPPGPKPGALKTELRSVKVVSAGRFALPVPPSRTEDVAATPRAVCPGDSEGAGGLVSVGSGLWHP